MMPGKFHANYCRALIIVHGASEFQIASYIKRNLRLPMEIVGKDSGKHSIQINGLVDYLKKLFPSRNALTQDIIAEINDKRLINFIVFTIMDTDDCDPPSLGDKYKDKSLFDGFWMKPYICPIYDTPSLEHILFNAGIIDKMLSDNEKMRVYRRIFPLDKNNPSQKGIVEIETFRDKIAKSKNSNLDVFVDYCLEWAEDNRVK